MKNLIPKSLVNSQESISFIQDAKYDQPINFISQVSIKSINSQRMNETKLQIESLTDL